MNGWQRIGIVASIAWSLAVVGFSIYETEQLGMPFLTRHELADREVYIKLRQVHLVDIERTSPNTTELYRLIQEHQKSTTEDEKIAIKARIIELNRTEAYTLPSQNFYLALTLPILLVWAIAYVGIAAWRWVAAGFSRS